MAETVSPGVVPPATEHEDPPSGISLRLALAVFFVSAVLTGGFFVAREALDDDVPFDRCAGASGLELQNCVSGRVTRG